MKIIFYILLLFLPSILLSQIEEDSIDLNFENVKYKTADSNCFIYKTGIARDDTYYNDWCFVRVPENYNPNRKIPYPFVICNHGNGWVMDGTLQKANYSSKTQFGVDVQNDSLYFDTANPYYNKFSNETIERLLEAGYIVCGTQNYRSNEYGSDAGRNSLQDFYFHMKQNWNVEEKCFMIGVSNGALMTLNGAYLLGIQNIKAIVLKYPLICLFRHYKGSPPHQTAINRKYNLRGNESNEELHAAFNDHDPEYANTIKIDSIRYKTVLLPPIKVWYSEKDSVTKSSNNAEPFVDLIERSYGKIEYKIVDGNHGSYNHFEPIDVLNFLNKYK